MNLSQFRKIYLVGVVALVVGCGADRDRRVISSKELEMWWKKSFQGRMETKRIEINKKTLVDVFICQHER